MITTPNSFLEEVSSVLNETTTDTSAKRVNIFNRSARFTVNKYKFNFRIKSVTLPFANGTQEYDLTDAVNIPDNDYDMNSRIYQVWNGTEEIYPVSYDRKSFYTNEQRFYLSPDDTSIGFTKDIEGTETYVLYYWATFKNASSYNSTLNIPIPEDFIIPIGTYMKHLVHESKRQRYDSRNAILDYQEQMKALILKFTSAKTNKMPRTIPSFWDYTSFKRSYDR